MPEVTTFPGLQQKAPAQPFACHLRPKHVIGRRGPVQHMAEVELQNVSASPVEIAYRMTVLQYLHLVITDADGKIVSTGHFGDRFAPTLEPSILRLEPGEQYTASIHLLATLPDPIRPGVYSVQAVYDYDGCRTSSEVVPVSVQ